MITGQIVSDEEIESQTACKMDKDCFENTLNNNSNNIEPTPGTSATERPNASIGPTFSTTIQPTMSTMVDATEITEDMTETTDLSVSPTIMIDMTEIPEDMQGDISFLASSTPKQTTMMDMTNIPEDQTYTTQKITMVDMTGIPEDNQTNAPEDPTEDYPDNTEGPSASFPGDLDGETPAVITPSDFLGVIPVNGVMPALISTGVYPKLLNGQQVALISGVELLELPWKVDTSRALCRQNTSRTCLM